MCSWSCFLGEAGAETSRRDPALFLPPQGAETPWEQHFWGGGALGPCGAGGSLVPLPKSSLEGNPQPLGRREVGVQGSQPGCCQLPGINVIPNIGGKVNALLAPDSAGCDTWE